MKILEYGMWTNSKADRHTKNETEIFYLLYKYNWLRDPLQTQGFQTTRHACTIQ